MYKLIEDVTLSITMNDSGEQTFRRLKTVKSDEDIAKQSTVDGPDYVTLFKGEEVPADDGAFNVLKDILIKIE